MPVGKPGPDGTIVSSPRHHRGSGGIGTLLQWDCPGCGVKHEAAAQPPEQGCPACGAGVPGAGKQAEPAAVVSEVPAQTTKTGGVTSTVPRGVRVPLIEPLDEVTSTVYRLIAYSGPAAWLEETLRRSLVGRLGVAVGGVITATIVDDVSVRQADLLRLASRQPGVWMGGPPTDVRHRSLLAEAAPEGLPAPRVVPHREYKQVVEQPRMAHTPSPVTPTPDQQMIATAILGLVGWTGGYTIANALQQFSTVVEDETMERDKYWSPAACLGVATALLDTIPADWQPTAQVGEETGAAPPRPPQPNQSLRDLDYKE